MSIPAASKRPSAAALAGLGALLHLASGAAETASLQVSPKPVRPPYELRVQLAAQGEGVGPSLVLDYVSDIDRVDITFAPATLSIVRFLKGARQTLATRRGWRPRPGTSPCAIRVRRSVGGIAVAADGVCVARVGLPSPAQARIGIRNPAEGGRLGKLRVQPLGQIVFDDDFMRTESSPSQWEPQSGEWRVSALDLAKFSVNAFCYAGCGAPALTVAGQGFWADYWVAAAVRMPPGVSGVGIAFAVRDADNLHRFEWVGQGGAGTFRLIRRRAGKDEVLATREGILGADQWYEFEVLAVGGRIEAGVDRRSAFEVDEPSLYGGKIGLWCQGSAPAYFDDVRVRAVADHGQATRLAQCIPRRDPVVGESFARDKYMQQWAKRGPAHGRGTVLDYTFHYAPVDWLVYTGQWGVRARWACQPRWTWFGGRGPLAVTLWHKDRFAGDVSAEVFAAHPMDSPFDPVYRHPGNINLTICGDGQNLNSGYSFIFAGWGNRWNRLLRRGEVVAETQAALIPDNRDRFHYKDMHINWRSIRVHKTGRDIVGLVDGKQILRWTDAEPLTGQKVAVWTFDNTILLARGRITAERVAPGAAAPPRWDFEERFDQWLTRDGEHGAALSLDATAGRRSSLKLLNAKSGGTFAASVPIVGIDAATSAINFDYCVGPDVKVNLYLKVRGWWYSIGFTAPDVTWWRAPSIGRFDNVRCDGQWHSTSFRLAERLTHNRLVLPLGEEAKGQGGMLVEDAFMGLRSDDPYTLCGFQGNPAGASYHIDNFVHGAQPPSAGSPQSGATALQVSPALPHQPATAAPVESRTPPGPGCIRCDDWQSIGGADGLRILSTPWEKPDHSRCILVVNERLGGIAAAGIRSLPFDASQYPIVAFDYKTDDTPRLDFHVELAFGNARADRWRTVKFTDADHAWDVIGRAGTVERDGRWHHCEFDLGQMLRKNGDDLTVTRLLLASGGYPGNEEGAHVCFDNFRLIRHPNPANRTEDNEPPTVHDVTPANDAASGACRIALRLVDRGTGVVPASIRLWVAGRRYSLSDPALEFDRKPGLLTWDGLAVRPRPAVFGDGAIAQCRIETADAAGNPKRHAWRWRLSYALDKTPPPAPWVTRLPSRRFLWHEFEEHTPSWGDWGGCDVRRTHRASATGDTALAITKFDATRRFLALCDVTPIPVAKFPYVALDYMIEPVPGLDKLHYAAFMLVFDGQTDRCVRIGPLPAADAGQWQHIEFDLRRLAKQGMGAPYGLLVGESRRKYPRVGNRIYVDNFAVYSRSETSVHVRWRAPDDASGVSGFSWCLDGKPDTVPDETVDGVGTEAQWRGLAPGTYHFHIRARDGAGNWGLPRHRGIVLE